MKGLTFSLAARLQLDDVGEVIEKIRIGHNNKGLTAGWHLERVEVRRLQEDGQSCTTHVFPCNRWLAKGEDDGAIVRELVPQKVLEETVSDRGDVKTKEREQATLDGMVLCPCVVFVLRVIRHYFSVI